MHGETVKSGVP